MCVCFSERVSSRESRIGIESWGQGTDSLVSVNVQCSLGKIPCACGENTGSEKQLRVRGGASSAGGCTPVLLLCNSEEIQTDGRVNRTR